MKQDFILASFKEARDLLDAFLKNPSHIQEMEKVILAMSDCLQYNGKILTCGNGGSLCDSLHFAEELTGRFIKNRRPLGAISLADPAHMSCVANDFGYDFIFLRQVEALGRTGDILLGISTSGNSLNVINAVEAAKKQGMKTVALLGKDGGRLKEMVDHALIVEHGSTARIQEIHIKIIHILIEGIERKLFPENY